MQPDFIDDAKEELKRVDHLIYVSLKYTRTVDVIMSIIERLLSCYDIILKGLLEQAKEEGKIDVVPATPMVQCEMLLKLHDDKVLKPYLDFYILLRKMRRAKLERFREFRRHVTMAAEVDEKVVEVTIDIISDYFERIKELVKYVEEEMVAK